MIYTDTLRVQLLKALITDEAERCEASPTFMYELTRAIACTELGRELELPTEDEEEQLGQDWWLSSHTPDAQDVGSRRDDALRVAILIKHYHLGDVCQACGDTDGRHVVPFWNCEHSAHLMAHVRCGRAAGLKQA